MFNSLYENTNNGLLYLPCWQFEKGHTGSFFKCRIPDEEKLLDAERGYGQLEEDMDELAAYYRDSGAAFGTRPDFTEFCYLEDALPAWERYFEGFTGLDPISPEFDTLARQRIADSDAAKYVIILAQLICEKSIKGLTVPDGLEITRCAAEAYALSLCASGIEEITLSHKKQKHYFTPAADVTDDDLRAIAALLKASPQLSNTGLGHSLLMSDIFTEPYYLRKNERAARSEKNFEQRIEGVVSTLPGFYEELIRQRYGLDDGRIKTFEVLAAHYRISTVQARELAARALRRLRHPNRAYKLTEIE